MVKSEIVFLETIEQKIFLIRGQKIMLDRDLAALYGIQTKALNQAVKRNIDRFPDDFVFQLTGEETESVARSRSQSVTLKRGSNIKYLPYDFTEHGAIMAANVLNSVRYNPSNAKANFLIFQHLQRVPTSCKRFCRDS